MTDIVERLRESAIRLAGEWRSGPCILLREAADEIERLRAEDQISHALLTDAKAEIGRLREVVVAGDREIKASHADADRLRAEITRLRAAVKEIADDPGGNPAEAVVDEMREIARRALE